VGAARPLLIGSAALAAAGGVALWVRYLARRQHHWRGLLAEAIPVHSLYWREQAALKVGAGTAANAGTSAGAGSGTGTGSGPGVQADGASTGSAQADPLLYVAIGDSAAQGIGASRPAHGYVGFLARHLRERTGGPVRVVNLGISGARLREAIEKELPRLAKLRPDVLTVCIGANDMADFDPARFEREIANVFDALPPHTVVADLPSFYFLPAERKVLVANRMLREAAAARGLRVVGLHRLTERQGLWGVSTQFAGDLFHPNDRGYRVWAKAFTPALDERLRTLGR
jgi:acyl-CoA thioesterase-1